MPVIKTLPDQTVEMTFPISGLDLSQAFWRQLPRTTPSAQNVQTYEGLTQRGRGGSRPMLAKYIAGAISGSNLIQELAVTVTTSPSASILAPAIVYVQGAIEKYASVSNDPTRTAFTTVATSGSVTAGNILVLVVATQSILGVPSATPTDSLGTLYVQAVQYALGLEGHTIYYGIAPASGVCTVTVTQHDLFCEITNAVLEYKNVRGFEPLDGTTSHKQSLGGTPPQAVTTGTCTVSQPGTLVVVAFAQGSQSPTYAADVTQTLRLSQPIALQVAPPYDYEALYIQDRIVNGSIAGLGSFTAGTMPIACVGLAISLKPAAGSIQASSSGRVVTLVGVRSGEVYCAHPGDTAFTAAQNNTGRNPPLVTATGDTDTTVVRSAQNGNYLYFADSRNLVRYSPATNIVETWPINAGTFPVGPSGKYHRLIVTWRGRTVVSGYIDMPQNIFMSRIDDPTDWNPAPTNPSPDEAGFLTAGFARQAKDVVMTLIPYSDDVLIVGCANSTWLLQGDPGAGGQMQLVSDIIGMAWGIPWCKDPSGTVYFVSNRGSIYTLVPGQQPQRISQQIEQLVQAIDTGTQTIRLAWDDRFQAIRVFITNTASQSSQTHYIFETRSGSWFPVVLPSNMDPQCLCVFDGNNQGDRVILLGSWDGYVRAFSTSATTDDGTAMTSYVVLGPILTPTMADMLVKDMQAVLGETSGAVSYAVYVGKSAEAAITSTAVSTGTLAAGRSGNLPVRRSGHALWLKLTSTVPWALDQITWRIAAQGKVRQRSA